MKVLIETSPTEIENPAASQIRLPLGLIGFPEHKQVEFLYQPDQLPFLWMHLEGPKPLHFVVIEPAGLIPGYEPEIFDEDAAFLEIKSSNDAAIFNIVTVSNGNPLSATVNLVGPIVVNRHNGRGKQVVLANHTQYSTHYPLVDLTPTATAASF